MARSPAELQEQIDELYALVEAIAARSPVGLADTPFRVGKTDASHAKGATGTISIYSGSTKGGETDTTNNFEGVYNRFADLESGKWVLLLYVDGGWELVAGECE